MSNRRLNDLLGSGAMPGEDEAKARAWNVVRAAYAEREPVSWPRKHARPLLAAAAAAALVAAAFTPPGTAVFKRIRDAVGTERVEHAAPALDNLPGGGALLVSSSSGTWVAYPNGSRRHFGPYTWATFSPHSIFIAGTRGHELVTFEPTRSHDVHWVISHRTVLSRPVWGLDGYRIAYFAGRSLRVVVGDGSRDRLLAPVVSPVTPAWRPLPIHEPKGSRHVLAYVGARGGILVVDTDTRQRLWRAPRGDGVRALMWSDDGRRLLVVGRSGLRVYPPDGRQILSYPTTGATLAAAFAPQSHTFAFVVGPTAGRSQSVVLRASTDHLRPVQVFHGGGRFTDLAWSPTGAWLLIAWKSADQWLFVRSARVRKLVAVSAVTRQFPGGTGPGTFPRLEGWCCAP